MEPPIQTDFISMVVPMQVLQQHATGRSPDVVVSICADVGASLYVT